MCRLGKVCSRIHAFCREPPFPLPLLPLGFLSVHSALYILASSLFFSVPFQSAHLVSPFLHQSCSPTVSALCLRSIAPVFVLVLGWKCLHVFVGLSSLSDQTRCRFKLRCFKTLRGNSCDSLNQACLDFWSIKYCAKVFSLLSLC